MSEFKFEVGQEVKYIHGKETCKIVERNKTKHHGNIYKYDPQPDDGSVGWYYESVLESVIPKFQVEVFE